MREHERSRRRLNFRVLTSIGLLSRVTITISLPVYRSQSVASKNQMEFGFTSILAPSRIGSAKEPTIKAPTTNNVEKCTLIPRKSDHHLVSYSLSKL